MAFKIKLTERKRNYIAISLVIINCIAMSLLLYLFYTGVYIYVYLKKSAHLLKKELSAGILGIIYMIISFVLMVEHSLLCSSIYYARRSKRRQKLIKSKFLLYISYFYVLTAIIIIPAVIIYTFSHKNMISSGFKSGIYSSMKLYGKELQQKQILDELQYDYECCGSHDYKDWFKIQWIHEDYSKDHNWNESTPFSCCRRLYLGVCHNQLISSEQDSRTLNSKGCAAKFTQFLEYKLYTAITLWIFVFTVQVFTLILFQYWTVSIENALFRGHPKVTSYGWLWGEKGLVKEYDRDPEVRKRLLSPNSKEGENHFQSDSDLYNDTINESTLTKPSILANPPKPPSQPSLRRIAAPPSPSPRSKIHDHSSAFISIMDHQKSKSKDNALSNQNNFKTDSSIRETVRGKSTKSLNSLKTDNIPSLEETVKELNVKSAQESDEEEEETVRKPKRKYHERYYILKEIR